MDNQLFTTIALLTLAFTATLSSGASIESDDCITPLYLFEVCGENNITYSNPEHAGCEEVAVACDGACPCTPAQQQQLCKARFYLYTVCGENNKTYDNPDLAKCENVDVACDGPCPCNKPTVNPIEEPSCLCATIFDPVCGKDGVEYPNSCVAACDKKEVACDGPCPCNKPTVNPIEEPSCVCSFIFDPVCGKDGVEYPNACAAGCDKVEVACEGPCPCNKSTVNPIDDLPCFCATILDPVCGKDGVEYPNACAAECDKVEVACDGPCPCNKSTVNPIDEPLCVCAANLDPVCGKDGVEYPNSCVAACESVNVACNGSCPCPESSANIMKRTSCVCATIFDPVCGNDGNDYPNACTAGCEDVEVACEGSCPCSPIKDPFCACPFNFDPVCGSNGIRYPNSCAAACEGVAVDCRGQCPCSY